MDRASRTLLYLDQGWTDSGPSWVQGLEADLIGQLLAPEQLARQRVQADDKPLRLLSAFPCLIAHHLCVRACVRAGIKHAHFALYWACIKACALGRMRSCCSALSGETHGGGSGSVRVSHTCVWPILARAGGADRVGQDQSHSRGACACGQGGWACGAALGHGGRRVGPPGRPP